MSKFMMDIRRGYKDCGCMETVQFEIDGEDKSSIDKFFEEQKDRDGKCPKCKAIDEQYHMVKTTRCGDFDSITTIYLFDTQDIRTVVRYCWIQDIKLHDEHYHIGGMYDCTGQIYAVTAQVTRGKRYIAVRNTAHRDV